MALSQNIPIQVIVKYCDSRSGGEGVAYRFCKYLQEQKRDFIMICGENKEAKKGNDELAEHIVELGMLRPTRLIKFASFFSRAERYIAKNRGLAFSFERVRGAHVLRLADAHACFLQQSLDGLSETEKRKKQRARAWNLYNRYAVWQEGRAVKSPSVQKIIVPSYMTKQELCSLYPERSGIIATIHNGVDTHKFYPANAMQREEARAAYGQALLESEPKRIIGFAGNAFQRKGLSHCIASLASLPDDVVLLVAGDDNKEPYVQQAREFGVEHRVRFLGHITDMPRFFHALDLFCLPSRNDPFGFVIAEAIAAGVPVVTTENAGGAEIVHQGYSGVICPQIDDASVCHAIEQGLLLKSSGIAETAPDGMKMFEQYLALADEARLAL